jgi:hypothetical protein
MTSKLLKLLKKQGAPVSRQYSSITPLPRISEHVPASQRFGETADEVTKWILPLGASSTGDVKWDDVSGSRETRALPRVRAKTEPLSWPVRIAIGGLALALLPLYLVASVVNEERA